MLDVEVQIRGYRILEFWIANFRLGQTCVEGQATPTPPATPLSFSVLDAPQCKLQYASVILGRTFYLHHSLLTNEIA